jgi:hypothetical protein
MARSGEPPASRRSQALITAERATRGPTPEPSVGTALAIDASALKAAAPQDRTEPQPSAAPPLPVAVAPPAAPTTTAPPRPPIMELPQSRSARAAPAAPTTAAATAAEPARVHVRIGKVEVRASAPAATPARVARATASRGFSDLRLARAHLDRNHR